MTQSSPQSKTLGLNTHDIWLSNNSDTPQHGNRNLVQVMIIIISILWVSILMCVARLFSITKRAPVQLRPKTATAHLLVVLGSGGHTAEMLNILSGVPDLDEKYQRRTYIVSSGDVFSARKACDFEKSTSGGGIDVRRRYEIVTVRRARRVHQSLLTAPWTSMLCFWDCLTVLRGKHRDQKQNHGYPDLILTNGPGTGVCVVVACLALLFFGLGSVTVPYSDVARPVKPGQMRTIFIESWARVSTLSLSGRLLRGVVDRFLVQWPQLAEPAGGGGEYIGPLVS